MDGSLETRIQKLHQYLGESLVLCNQLIATVVLLGLIFFTGFAFIMLGLQNPAKLLQLEGASLNYQQVATPAWQLENVQNSQTQDPDWDGVLSGAEVGLALGQGLPLVGPIVGPLAGAIFGYEADRQH